MFTQAMPAFANAMRNGQMFPAMQALGNCAQPLTHRGGVNFAPSFQRQAPGQPGVYNSPGWNPSAFSGLFPNAGQVAAGGVTPQDGDLAGMNANWNNGNRYDSQFYFPTNQFFAQNQFFGGPQVNIQGGLQTDVVNANTYQGDNVNVENVTTEVINGTPAAAQPGRPGEQGREGRPGAPGFPGRNGKDGAILEGQFAELRYLWGIQPRVDFQPVDVQKPHRYVKDAWVANFATASVPSNAISGGTVALEGYSVAVPTGVTFDPATCEVTFTGTTTIYHLGQQFPVYEVLGTPASTVSIVAATTAGSTLASLALADAPGVLIKRDDDDFWGGPDPVLVARNPELKGVIPQPPRQVFQK